MTEDGHYEGAPEGGSNLYETLYSIWKQLFQEGRITEVNGGCPLFRIMMTSSNGNIFRVTGHLCGNSPVPGEFPAQRPVTRSFDVFFDLRLNGRLSKQSWGWWLETPSHPLWRHGSVLADDKKKSVTTVCCHRNTALQKNISHHIIQNTQLSNAISTETIWYYHLNNGWPSICCC